MIPPAFVVRFPRRALATVRGLVVAMLLMAAGSAPGRAQDTVQFTAGGTSPVDTAWGNFQAGLPDVVVCQELAFNDREALAVERSVRGQELVRFNRVLELLGAATGEGSKRLLVTVDGAAHVLAYRVNATGDPGTLTPFATPSE